MIKTIYITFLFAFTSLCMLQAQTGNRVFEGAEATNFGVIDLSVPGGQSWSTFRGANPGYFSNVGTATYVNAADALANVNGYVKHYATSANQLFTFPVGTGTDLRSITISGSRTANSEIAVAWILGDPNTTTDPTGPNAGLHSTASLGSGIEEVSTIGQWDWQDISNDAAGLTVTVSIPDLTSFGNASELRLVGFNGTSWVNLSGNTSASGNTENSSLTGIMLNGITAIAVGRAIDIDGDVMITQVYQFDNERWVEITNISNTTIPANTINVQLYKDKSGDQTGVTPDATVLITSPIASGQSVLFRNSANSITNTTAAVPTTSAIIIENNTLTDIEGGNDIITISSSGDTSSWANRYDVVTSFPNKTSFVRIDETLVPNATYTPGEWVVFIDDALDPLRLLGNGGAERHPHDPLVSEIVNSNTDANTLLGLHRINITTTDGSNGWDNGYPDRSRFVVIDENYNHTTARLSARRLTVNASRKLGITNNLLVVTNDIVLNGDIRLIDTDPFNSDPNDPDYDTDTANRDDSAQLIQTHTSATLVSGGGRLLIDQNSTVPSLYRYNYIGSPVKNAVGNTDYTIASILKDGTNPTDFNSTIGAAIAKDITFVGGTNYDGNFTNSPSQAITLADYWMYTYAADEGTRASWLQQRSTGAIPNTDGFIFKGPGRPQNYTFMGTPKDGNLTTTVGGNESYLVGNPYPSAISVKEFIEDNDSSILGTLYFWEHAGENEFTEGTSQGHNFAGYIGGYATRTISMGVSALAAAGGGNPVDVNIEAENSNNTGTVETILDNDGSTSIDAVLLNSVTDSIVFRATRSVDTLRLRYKTLLGKTLEVKVNGVLNRTLSLESTLNATQGIDLFENEELGLCVVSGDQITIKSTNVSIIETLQIDYLNFKDGDGQARCAPNVSGGENITYTEPEPYIAVGQGFFVSSDADGGTITFNNSQREYITEGDNQSLFLKSSSTKTDGTSFSNLPVIKLGMDFNSSGNISTYHRQIGVSFSPFTSFNFDKGYDAEIFDVGATDFYWKFPNNDTKYVITGVQSIYDGLEVPLEIKMSYSGEITLMIDELKNYTGDLYIIDKVNGMSYSIKSGKANISLDIGTYTDRFFLAFKPINALSINDGVANAFTNMYVDNQNKSVVINKKQEIDINKVQLFNLLGKQVASWKINEQKEKYVLEINKKLPTGVYIIKLNSDKGESNKKVIVE